MVQLIEMIRLGMAALLFGLAIVPGQASLSQQPGDGPPLVLLVATDQPSYAPGSTATITVAVDNPGSAPITATFSSTQLFDVLVLKDDAEVWRASAGQGFAQMLVDRTFQPGLTLLGRVQWDWRDESGAPLQPGAYRMVGRLMTTPPRHGNPLEVTLSAP